MARLRTLAPRLTGPGYRLGLLAENTLTESERDRTAAAPWRRWYKTRRWRDLRMQVLTRDLFQCQMPGCGKIMRNTADLVCDHIRPHRGDEQLFWAEDNLQCLCAACHDGRKQKEEQDSRQHKGIWY